MRFELSLLLCLWGLATAVAQEPPYTQIYRLTEAQAARLYRDLDAEPDSACFRTLIDTFSTPAYRRSLPSGHYLFVRARWEELEVTLRSVQFISAVLMDDTRDLVLRVIDSTGREVSDAEVVLRQRRVPYDTGIAAYRLRRHKRGGFLTVRARGETAYYELTNTDPRSMFTRRLQRFSGSRLGWLLSTPVRWGRNSYYYFRNGFAYGYWQAPFRRLFTRRYRPFRGYIALSQPRYRPGDTLRVKAYVARPNGRPWRRPLELTVFRRWDEPRPVLQTELSPLTPGAFVYELPLGDSLRLDDAYQARFTDPRKGRFGQLQQTFQLEDYELDEAVYSLESRLPVYRPGEPVVLSAEGKDYNGLPAPDARVRLVVRPGSVISYYADEVLLPDTLWTHEQELDPGGPTVITLPDSLFPAVKLEALAQAAFVNSSGELQEQSTHFTYDAAPRQIQVYLDGGDVVAECRENGSSIPALAQLTLRSADRAGMEQSRAVSLPWREALNPYVSTYALRLAGGEAAELALSADDPATAPQVSLAARWSVDSLSVVLRNPRRLSVKVRIRTHSQEIWQSQTEEEQWRYTEPSPEKTSYFVDYQWVWGGETHQKTEIIRAYQQLLSISVDQPDRIYPGETVQFSLEAQDYRGRPAGGVNLVAGAVNAQFGDRPHYTAPQVRYRREKPSLPYGPFALNRPDARNERLPLTTGWVAQLHLTDSLFYRLRYPPGGVFLRYDTAGRDSVSRHLAQFAPYIVREGKSEPVFLIYCNRELVYYYDVQDHPPYSFLGLPGYNQIVVRTRTVEYTIDSVQLFAGKKLELALDADRYAASSWASRIRQRAMPPEWTAAEKSLLRKRLFIFRELPPGEQHFLWQGNRIHRVSPRRGRVTVGPFLPNASLHYAVRHGWERTFPFEPGFDYEVFPSRERLYARDPFPENKAMLLPESLPPLSAGQTVYSPDDIDWETPAFRQPLLSRAERRNGPGRGVYVFEYALPDSLAHSAPLLVALTQDDSTVHRYYPQTRRLANLLPGEYRLYLFFEDGRYLRHSFRIRPDTTLFQRLSGRPLSVDPSVRQFRSWLSGIDPTVPEAGGTAYSSSSGRLIRGRLLDENGEPLIGASVLVKGTSIGAVTDIDGNYEIWAPAGAGELVFSYTGFSTREVTLGNRREIDATLSEESALLESAVVTAQGMTRVRGLTTLAASSADLLEGRAAGVAVSAVHPWKETGRPVEDPFSEADPDSRLPGAGLRSDFRDYGWWQPNLITDPQGRAFFTVTYPDNITQWRTFVLGMDRRGRAGAAFARTAAFREVMAQLAVPRFLVAGDRSTAVGKAVNYRGDTLAIRTTFQQEGASGQTAERRLGPSVISSFDLLAPTTQDSLCLSFVLQMGDYRDGERRCIPLFPPGLRETVGSFHFLEGDTTLILSVDPRYGPVTLHAEANLADWLEQDLRSLENYPFDCNEQTASRLIALLLRRSLMPARGEAFDGEGDIRRALLRLERAQQSDGSWGWWPESPSNAWMTIYVLDALHRAQEAGFEVPALEKGWRYLTGQLPRLDTRDRLLALDLLSRQGQRVDAAPYLAVYDTLRLPLYERLLTLRIRQRQGLDFSLDTLFRYRRHTVFGGQYWTSREDRWYDSPVQVTLLAYDILREAGRREDLAAIRRYFLSQRQSSPWATRGQGWRNTFETACILQAILPDLPARGSDKIVAGARLTLSGGARDSVDRWPYTQTWPADRPLELRKTGDVPAFLAVYQSFQNPAPQRHDSIFAIDARLEQEGRPVTRLRQGERATLIIDLEVKRAADYVLIEAPIPAGCSYADRAQPRRFPEVHREYRREKTAIFCERLPVGHYTFTVELEARFSGDYALNPARAEAMYFPVFSGNDEGGRVQVK